MAAVDSDAVTTATAAPPGMSGANRRNPVRSQQRSHVNELKASAASHLPAMAGFGVAAALLLAGFGAGLNRYIAPNFGLGYWLGISGGMMMVLLLVYPIRKRSRALAWLGPTRHWFRFHMAMGIAGPICILYHCTFAFGALNSNVALVCMLTVASSGFIGRYFYGRIHYGLYGARATLDQLRADEEFARKRIGSALDENPELRNRLDEFAATLTAPKGVWGGLVRVCSMGIRTRLAYAGTLSALRQAIRASAADTEHADLRYREAREYLAVYLDTIRKVAEIDFYERLFALWHILHVPLFAMMVLSAIAHVVAVHMF